MAAFHSVDFLLDDPSARGPFQALSHVSWLIVLEATACGVEVMCYANCVSLLWRKVAKADGWKPRLHSIGLFAYISVLLILDVLVVGSLALAAQSMFVTIYMVILPLKFTKPTYITTRFGILGNVLPDRPSRKPFIAF